MEHLCAMLGFIQDEIKEHIKKASFFHKEARMYRAYDFQNV